MSKSVSPSGRLGIYKALSDVPDRRRLYRFAPRYEGRDAFAEWVEHAGGEWSDRWLSSMNRAGRRWAEHVEARTDAPDPALVRPEHVESFYTWLLNDAPGGQRKGMSVGTARRVYVPAIEGLYRWLTWSSDHPGHTYNPVLMAYNDPENEHAREIWAAKVGRTKLEAAETTEGN